MNTRPAPFPFVQNLAIMASAGTGKTYQLSMRFITLLLLGAKPEEIAALTFSRKAAGEILEDIVSNLMDLIREQGKLEKAISEGFIPPGTTTKQLSGVLSDILSCRHKLHIETNDSFLFQIVQAAPAEFGIRGEIAMIDENDDRPRQRALLQILHDPRFAGDDPEGRKRRNEIYRVMRDISFGKDKATIYGEITELLKYHYRAFLEFPEMEHWTLPGRRPSEAECLSSAQLDDLQDRLNHLLEDAISRKDITDSAAGKLLRMADLVWKVPAERYVWKDLQDSTDFLDVYEKIRKENAMPEPPAPTDTAKWTFSRHENTLRGPILQILYKMARHLSALEFFALEKKTQAVFSLMDLLDSSFSAQTRAAGKISFSDILYLINRKQENDYGTLQVLRERLGMTIGHYLLDEFQDTSTAQWLAFRDLAEEVIQNGDPSRFTSFFMVGDIKQSIYQWRDGNPALFMQICRDQNFLPETGKDGDDRSGSGGLLKSLTCSHRSSAPVLQLVNDVFAPETSPAFPSRLTDQADIFIRQVKKMRFEKHSSGLDEKDHPEIGCSLVLSTPGKGNDDATWKAICALIKKLDPFSSRRKKTLSVAVLFRKNDSIGDCYEAMKRIAPELNVSREGTVALKNSMAYAVFRQLLLLAAHPGSSAASAYLSMIRLADGSGGLDTIRERLFPREEECDLPRRIREELDQAGPGAFLQRFRTAFPETERESEYMECLANALAAMETETLSPDERIALLDEYKVAKRSLSKTVQLMTIHKSKGLGFDIVIVPFNEKRPGPGSSKIVEDEDRGFCYFEPNAGFIPLFPEIEANAESRKEKSIYELGCTVYVALTRAKRSTIVILPEEAAKSSASILYPTDILRRAGKVECPIASEEDTDRFLKELAPYFDSETVPLTPIYCAGDPFWTEQDFSSKKITEAKPSDREKDFRDRLRCARPGEDTPPLAVFSRHPESEASETAPPSFHSFEIEPASRFLTRTAADFGTRVHEILSELEWLGSEEETKEFLRRFEDAPEAVRLLESALSKPDIANALRHPAAGTNVRLFREQPFLLRTGENEPPVSGIIDRAAVEYDEAGIPVRAEIIDYKTDSAGDPELFRTRYRRQLEIYRRAMSELTGLPEPQIACTILALRPGLAVSL